MSQSMLTTFIYIAIAAIPTAVWTKYFFIGRYKKEKKTSMRIREFMTLVGIFGLSLLSAHLLFYSYETFKDIPRNVFWLSAFLALIPVIVWSTIVYKKRLNGTCSKKKKRDELILVMLIFFLGTLTVPLLNVYYGQVSSSAHFNYYEILGEMVVEPHVNTLNAIGPDSADYQAEFNLYKRSQNIYDTITIVIDALLEEIVKLSLLIFFLRSMRLVKTIGDAIAFSVLAGLGFAFIENIIYFTKVYQEHVNDKAVFFNVVIFRSIVLSIGHMTFSGIFGYFYGLSRFGLPLYEERRWEGMKFPLLRIMNKLFKVPMDHAYTIFLFLEGMILAMLTHATFNSFLGFGARDYAVYLVILTGIYLYYLTQRKAGHLVLATFGRKKMSLMAPVDEDVVLELAGMWINEGKYKEVEDMCQRLEQKDPDNAVIKLLYAKAHDKRRMKRAKLALASLFFQEDIFEDDVSIFQKWKQIRAEREAVEKGVDVKIAEDLTPADSCIKKKPTRKSKKS